MPKDLSKEATLKVPISHCKFTIFHDITFLGSWNPLKHVEPQGRYIVMPSKSHSGAPSFPDTHFKLDGLLGFRRTHLRVLHENHPVAACFETLRPWHLWQSYYQLVDRYEHPVHKDLDTNVQWYLTPRASKHKAPKQQKDTQKCDFARIKEKRESDLRKTRHF